MPAYAFQAIDPQGATHQGVVEADSAKAARSQLRAQALVPLQVQAVESPGADANRTFLRSNLWTSAVLRGPALTIWTRQLAGLVGAGLTLERALTALMEEADSEPARNLVAALRAEVNAGASFAKALAGFPREFPGIYVAVVAAGEQSGRLGTVLERLAEDLEERQALNQRLFAATLYPAIVTVAALAIVILLMTYVVPQVASVFAGTKRSLPMLTVAMLAFSGFLRSWGPALLVLSAGGVVLLRLALRGEAFRARFDAGWLRLPLLGRFARSYNAARFAGTLAMLAGAGVPILKALQTSAETLDNRAMRADAMDALVLVREGAPLASALAQKKRFPALLPMFARLGEQTGQLPSMLQRAAAQLAAEVQRRAMHLATILEPLLVIAMGVVVLLIVLAVLLPIIQLNQWVR
jgi:general secretion pathway protein F